MRTKEDDDRVTISDGVFLDAIDELELATASKIKDEVGGVAIRTVHYRLNNLEEGGWVSYTPIREDNEKSTRIWELTEDGESELERLRQEDDD
jgi:DNA-binding MarR family transcriptional regulator